MSEEFGCLDLAVDEDFFFDFDPSVFTESPPAEDFTRSSPGSASSWIGEIESQLMNDDNHEQQNFLELDQQSVSDFLADILVDYPTSDSATANDSGLPTVDSPPTVGSNDNGKENTDLLLVESQDGAEIEGNDDTVAKKRTRRLRNRDAAVRSRERKKEYVKDLETKSKYLERECMRLGRMLQCLASENQSLRLCMQKGGNNNASITKQESAVLLLESLLLGSLLWYLGDIICQFPQPHTKSWFQSVETEEPERLAQSGRGSSIPLPSYIWKSRRCKASRPRMKQHVLTLVA